MWSEFDRMAKFSLSKYAHDVILTSIQRRFHVTYERCMNVETTSCAYLVSPSFLFQNRFTRVLGFFPKVKFWLRLLFFILSVYFLSAKNRVTVLFLHGIVFIVLVFFSGTFIEGLKKFETFEKVREFNFGKRESYFVFWCLISPVQVC